MVEFFTTLVLAAIEPIKPLFKQGFSAVLRWVFRDSPRAIRYMMIVSAVASILLGLMLWQRVSSAGKVLLGAMSESQEPGAQPYKGLEAFLITGLNADIDDSLRGVRLRTEIAGIFAEIQDAGQKAAARAVPPAPPDPLKVVHVDNQHFYLTDDVNGFLFVPSNVLAHQHPEATKPGTLTLTLSATEDAEVLRDIRASQAVAVLLERLKQKDLFEKPTGSKINDTPVQLYYIARSGVTRLFEMPLELGAAEQRDYYIHQFPATTLFNDRPYFNPALKATGGDFEVGRYFHVTKPYIDLGGNGIVKTFCRSAGGPDYEAIVCADLRIGDVAEETMAKRIREFGDSAHVLTCDSVCHDEEHSVISRLFFPSGVSDRENDVLSFHLDRLRGRGTSDLSEMFGKLHVYQSDGGATMPGAPLIPRRGLFFSVPLGSNPGPQRVAKLLYGTIDIRHYQTMTTILGASFGGATFMLVCLVMFMVVDYGLRLNEQNRAFQTVAKVMSHAPVGYCRGGEDNRFLEFNEAFALDLLEFRSMDDATVFLKETAFKDLLADAASKLKYEEIRAARLKRLPTPPYSVRLWKAGEKKQAVAVTIIGADVPGPDSPRGAPPETFGVIIRDRQWTGTELRGIEGGASRG